MPLILPSSGTCRCASRGGCCPRIGGKSGCRTPGPADWRAAEDGEPAAGGYAEGDTGLPQTRDARHDALCGKWPNPAAPMEDHARWGNRLSPGKQQRRAVAPALPCPPGWFAGRVSSRRPFCSGISRDGSRALPGLTDIHSTENNGPPCQGGQPCRSASSARNSAPTGTDAPTVGWRAIQAAALQWRRAPGLPS